MVMEGYTDCIVAHQFGFANAVAVLGTALGEAHIRILKRFADRIILVLDGDEAGQRRADEVLELFVAQQVDLRILTLPEEFDPCEFLQERGGEAFQKLLDDETVDALRTPCARRRGGSTLPVTFTPPARHWNGWWAWWPRPRGCTATRPGPTACASRRFWSNWRRCSASTRPRSAAT